MSFAGDQHHIAGIGALHGRGDGLRAVRFDQRIGWTGQAGHHLLQDEQRVFAARVVAGQHGVSCFALGHRRHQRAFARVAVATAADHGPQRATALPGQRLQGLQGLFQRVGRVGIVHQHQRLLVCSGHLLHAPRHWRERVAGPHRIGQRYTHRAGRCQHAQQVGHVVAPHQRQVQAVGPVTRPAACARPPRSRMPLSVKPMSRAVKRALWTGTVFDADGPEIQRSRTA
jgi:hypothetical protein